MPLKCGATGGCCRCHGKINVWVLEKIGTDLTIRRGIMERKLNYFGHIVRRSEGVEKQIPQGAVGGKVEVEVVHQYLGLMISRKCLDKE